MNYHIKFGVTLSILLNTYFDKLLKQVLDEKYE